MLLLLTTLAMAQDPAPTSASQDTVESQGAEDTEGEAQPAGWSGEAEESEGSTAPSAETEAPPPAGADPLPQAPVVPEAVPQPAQVDPALWGTYEEGYAAGRQAAEELADWVQPAVAGAGIGAGAAGVGVICGGLACGAPAVLGGAGYQAYKTRKDVPPPPPGAWQKRSAEFQTGFIQGFQARANQKRTRWALAGGATGAVVGAGVGLVVVAVIYDRQGRDFI